MNNSFQNTQLDLLRHGECEGGQIFRGSTDVPLTPMGWQQMTRSAAKSGGWDVIITSPLTRCTEFAHRLSVEQGAPLVTLPGLREVYFGLWEGQLVNAIQEQYPTEFHKWAANPFEFTPPEGEPLNHVANRIEKALSYCLARYEGKKLLWVVHGGVIRVTLALCIQKHLNSVNGWHVPYGCFSQLSHLEYDGLKRWQLLGHNLSD